MLRAIKEYDRLGPERFFSKHGFAPTTTYKLVWDKRRYPPRAILGTAYELATGQRFASADFEGGKTGAVNRCATREPSVLVSCCRRGRPWTSRPAPWARPSESIDPSFPEVMAVRRRPGIGASSDQRAPLAHVLRFRLAVMRISGIAATLHECRSGH
jgi:hypothetical protein